MIDVSKLSEHDRQLVEKAMDVTSPFKWMDVPDENLAESEEARQRIHNHVSALYHREEALAGCI